MENALIITPFYKPNIGGAETFAEELAKSLSEKYVVHICTISRKNQIVWQGIPFSKGFKTFSRLAWSFRIMKKKYKYDKIYALGLIASLVCMLNKVKFYSIILALYDFKKKNIIVKNILNTAEKIFVEGDKGKEDILNAGINEKRVVKFQHWCDQSKFQWLPRENKKMRVLFIGRPIKIKGRHIIEQCEKLTKDIEYEYIDNTPTPDLPKHYQMADVVVVPSLYSEGFSRVVVEAASCGCVVIGSNKGALPEMLKGFGWTVEPTAENFKNTLEHYRDNRVILDTQQIKTAWFAKKHFSKKNAEVFF